MKLVVWITVENLWGKVEYLSPQESAKGKGADTVLRGSMRASLGLSSGKPSATKPRGMRPFNFAASGFPSGALSLPH